MIIIIYLFTPFTTTFCNTLSIHTENKLLFKYFVIKAHRFGMFIHKRIIGKKLCSYTLKKLSFDKNFVLSYMSYSATKPTHF